MTRVVVDRELCMSSGVGEVEEPEVFALDEDGVLQVADRLPRDLVPVETAVRACPTGALQLVD